MKFPSYSRLSLLSQLAILLGTVFSLLWLYIAFDLQGIHTRTISAGQKEIANLVRVYGEETNSSIDAIDRTLIDLREQWQERPQNFMAKVRLRQKYLEKDAPFQISIIDARGMLAFSSIEPNTKAVNLSDREHFRAHITRTDDFLFVSKPVLERVSQRWSIQFTRSLTGQQGQFAGVIVLSVSPDYFTRFSQELSLEPGSVVALVRASGEIIARSPAPVRGLGETLRNVPVSESVSDIGFFRRTSQSDGVYRQYVWRSLPKYHVTVFVGRSMDEILAPYFRERKIFLWGGASVSILLALLGYILLTGLKQRTKARAALEESEFRWKYALEGAREGVWDWNNSTGEVFYSRRWKEMLGYAEHEIENRVEAWERLMHPEDKTRMLTATADYIAGKTKIYANEYRLLCKDYSWKWIFSRGMIVSRDASGKPIRIIGTHTDITERKRIEEAELEFQSNHDALTGLVNRTLLQDRANRAIARAAGDTRNVWIAYINLDRFKFVNDTLGHEAGDVLLQLVARRVQAVLSSAETAARVAGDEFAILFGDVNDEDVVTSTLQRVMDALAHPLTIEGHDYFLTCSVGIARWQANGENADTLIRHSQMAMHCAKEVGRNNIQFYTASMNNRAMDRLHLETDLRCALQRNELVLHYQPQVDICTGRIAGMEALLRWRHPKLGLVPPNRFIYIAEETGLIVPIGTWVLHSACQQTKKWHDAGFGSLRIGVNLSGKQFYQQNFIRSVEAVLESTGLDANYLDIELTEGMVMTDIEHALDIMYRLKQLGLKLSIDDFGTGYSSLSYLKRFPIDVLKIDQSFVRNITTDPGEAAIARSIITLAQSFQLEVIAEGVETEEQLNYLRRHRCNQIQGYYFSQPLAANEFEQLLIEDKRLPQANQSVDMQQTLLILDNEVNVVAALNRLLHRDGYQILRAHTAAQGLSLLALHNVQVVLSSQRISDMTGTAFLSKVKKLYPDTIRIMLSGYLTVDEIIEATNSGAVFRLHTKPWEDEMLRASIAEAFRYHWLMKGQ